MRPEIEWMTKGDDRILELLDESDLMLTPKVIARNISYSRGYVNTRLTHLEAAGLVERHNGERGGMYSIRYEGRAYLRGDIDADEIDEPEL